MLRGFNLAISALHRTKSGQGRMVLDYGGGGRRIKWCGVVPVIGTSLLGTWSMGAGSPHMVQDHYRSLGFRLASYRLLAATAARQVWCRPSRLAMSLYGAELAQVPLLPTLLRK